MKRKNKMVYLLSMIIIIIIYLVIIFFGDGNEKIVYVDKIPKQPINHIRNIIKDLTPTENDTGNKKDDKNKTGNIVKPNKESPIKYIFNEDLTQGNYIYMINQFPIKDEVGKKLIGEYKTFDFKLEFKKESLGASYDISLQKMESSDVPNPWVKVYLERDGVALKESIRNNGRIKIFSDYTKYNNSDNEIILYQGTVTESDIEKGYHDYTLRMWISEDVDVANVDYNGKSIIARVNVYAIGN